MTTFVTLDEITIAQARRRAWERAQPKTRDQVRSGKLAVKIFYYTAWLKRSKDPKQIKRFRRNLAYCRREHAKLMESAQPLRFTWPPVNFFKGLGRKRAIGY